MSDTQNPIEHLAEEVRDYAELRVDELKLKSVKALSSVMSGICSMLIITGVAVVVFGLLAYALLQWLNSAIGAPWGTLIVLAFFALILVVLILSRKSLFKDGFVRMFLSNFFSSDDNE